MNLLELLPPISPASPCGPDPTVDGDAGQAWSVFEAAREEHYNQWTEYRRNKDVPDRQPPSWHPLQTVILELALKTKHLRLAAELTETLAQTEGLRGLRDGLLLILNWSATWWLELHPAAGAARAILLGNLNHDRTIRRFQLIPVIESNELRGSRKTVVDGPFTMEDYTAATQPTPGDPERARLVVQTFAGGDPDLKRSNLQMAVDAREAAQALVELFTAKEKPLNLGNLTGYLDAVIGALRGNPPPAAAVETGESAGGSAGPAVISSAAIGSREAASAALDRVAAYFKSAEPSSPIPYLLQRAQRCMGRNYLEILEELGGDRTEADRVLKPQKNEPVSKPKG